MKILIVPSALRDIHDIAEKSYPYECCGFFYGHIENDLVHVLEATEVINDSVERDLEDALPELSYFITNVHQGQAIDTRSWRLTEDRVFIEEQIEINYSNK